MLFKILLLLLCLLLTDFFIQPTTCALPNNIQNLELDDVTSLWDKFPILIDKIKEAVNRFRCPKGWKRLGGSCYFFSNQTSTSFYANFTCNYLHSNLSNLMQIRNAVELYYAAHVLTRNNLSSLMIDIDPALLKGKKIAEMLTKDQGLWKRMKESLRDIRMKYQRLKQKVVDRLSLTGLKILRRTRKMKTYPTDEEILHHHMYSDLYNEYNDDHINDNSTDILSSPDITLNISAVIDHDEYEYDDLDSSDEIDEFEQINDTRRICDDIHWNVLNETSNATVFILTKYNMSDKIICSLSDVDSYTRYHHVCEYVLDFCFANILCGKHGQCVNTLTGFKCSCSFLYGGLLCEKISDDGRQIIISLILIIIMIILSIKIVRKILGGIIRLLIDYWKRLYRTKSLKKKNDDTKASVDSINVDNNGKNLPSGRRQTIVDDIVDIFSRKTNDPLLSPIKRNLVRNICVGVLSIIFLSVLFFITTIMYYRSFGYNIFTDEEHITINDTIRLVQECTRISDYRRGNITFAPIACALIMIFSWTIKREKLCVETCEGRPGLIPPIEPFRTGNRFTTATVFGIIAFEVLKIFEELLFSTYQPLGHGVLVELIRRIALVIVIGLRYYPVLASLQLRNLVARLLACLYIIGNIIYTIIREGSCMGFLPLSGQYTEFEEAKLRRELGTWFIIYGLIKNIPHFFFLSYIGAELCVRFAYDSVYIPLKKNESIWSTPIVPLDESNFAKYYVTKLFRRNRFQYDRNTRRRKFNPDNLHDHEHEAEQLRKENKSRFQRFINYFYESDDDFRFTTMVMSTYTVAVVFLYYLACTFVFLYITRTTGHVAFLKLYFESTFNVDLGAHSFQTEIILSAVIAGTLYAGQLFLGLKTYKKHKKNAFKGLYFDIPSSKNFKPDYIASHSVHYSGFLVGYMAWGFFIFFHLILLIAILFRVISLQIRQFELALGIIVPIFVIYLLKMLSLTSAGKFIFIKKVDDKLNLRSRRMYALFVYFSFFADCFLGIASCVIRLVTAVVFNVIFMARLDWSFLGRPLERLDHGFAAYVSYIHMERAYTNPVMLAFCYSLYDDIIQKRPGHSYADECCIGPGEPDDDMDIEAPGQRRPKPAPNLPPVRYRPSSTDNLSIGNSSSFNGSKTASQIDLKQHSSMETISDTQTSVLTEGNKKTSRTQRGSDTTNEESKSKASTTVRFVPTQQRKGPAVPPRQDLQSEHDDGSLRTTSFSTVGELVPKPQPRLKQPTDSLKSTPENRSEEDDDNATSQGKTSSKKTKKDISKTKVSQEENDDSEHFTDNDSPVQVLIPSNQLKLDSRKSNDTDDESTQTSQQSKKSDQSRNAKSKKISDKNPYEIVSSEEQATQKTTAYSLPSSHPNDAQPLRSISYCQAHYKTPPLSKDRSLISSFVPNRTNTNDDSSHYSEITNDTTRSALNNPSHSKKKQVCQEQKHSNTIDVENQEEEEAGSQEENHPLISSKISMPDPSDNSSTTHTEDEPMKNEEEDEEAKREAEKKRIQRRKRSRFRWHLLYTLQRNYRLCDLRKKFLLRLALLYAQKMAMRQAPLPVDPTTAEVPESAEHAVAFTEPPVEETSESSERRPPPPPGRMISIAESITSNDYNPSSPGEQYYKNRSQMLHDVNAPQRYSPNIHTSVTASINMQHPQPPISTTFSAQSLGFPVTSDDAIPSSSEIKTESRRERMVGTPTARAQLQKDRTPLEFLPTSASNVSTAEYPLKSSSIVTSPTYRAQWSYEQQMDAWRQNEKEKMQKKQRHTYIYEDTPKAVSLDRILATVILTPQIISTVPMQQQAPSPITTDQTSRQPTTTTSSSQFPRSLSVDPTPRRPTKSPFLFQTRTFSVDPTPRQPSKSSSKLSRSISVDPTTRKPTESPFSVPPGALSIDPTTRKPSKSLFQLLASSSRRPSASSSATSDTSSKTKTQRFQPARPQQGIPPPPPRMDRLDEDPQETSDTNKPPKSTSDTTHRKDSQSSDTTDKTED